MKNPNHPKADSQVKVEPIRQKTVIERIKAILLHNENSAIIVDLRMALIQAIALMSFYLFPLDKWLRLWPGIIYISGLLKNRLFFATEPSMPSAKFVKDSSYNPYNYFFLADYQKIKP